VCVYNIHVVCLVLSIVYLPSIFGKHFLLEPFAVTCLFSFRTIVSEMCSKTQFVEDENLRTVYTVFVDKCANQ
jgi:hypothetical protein